MSFNRPPRPAPLPEFEPLVAPEAPKATGSSRAFSVAVIAGPILMGAGMVAIYGNPRFALFAALCRAGGIPARVAGTPMWTNVPPGRSTRATSRTTAG